MNEFLNDLALVLVGAVLGFISTLIVNVLIEKRNDSLIRNKVQLRLIAELESIVKELERVKTDDRIYFRYNYPVWKMCINSGYLFSISGNEIYSEFEKVYMLLESATNIEMEYYILATRLPDDINLMNEFDQERKRRREEIIKCVNGIVKKERGKV